MRKLEMTNSLLESQTFQLVYDRYTGEEAITDLHGFVEDFKMNITYERSPFQQGATAVALRGDTRPLSFIIHLAKKNAKALDLRVHEIARFLNPYLGEVEIVHDNGNRRRMIHAYYVGHQLMASETSNGYGLLNIDMVADSALFEDEIERFATLGSDAGAFELPVTLPFTLGMDIVGIEMNNTGDYHHPISMIFLGPLTDPVLMREYYIGDTIVQTDVLEFQGLTVLTDWHVRVETTQGREEATLVDPNGVESNINRYLTVDSNYWQVFVGKNIIRFASQEGNPVTELRYKRKYIMA